MALGLHVGRYFPMYLWLLSAQKIQARGSDNLETTWGRFFLIEALGTPLLLPSKECMFSFREGMFFPPFF